MQGRELAPGPVMLGRLMTTNTLSKEGTSSKTLEDGNSGLRWADPRLHGLGDRKSEKAPNHDKPLFWALLRVLGCTISTPASKLKAELSFGLWPASKLKTELGFDLWNWLSAVGRDENFPTLSQVGCKLPGSIPIAAEELDRPVIGNSLSNYGLSSLTPLQEANEDKSILITWVNVFSVQLWPKISAGDPESFEAVDGTQQCEAYGSSTFHCLTPSCTCHRASDSEWALLVPFCRTAAAAMVSPIPGAAAPSKEAMLLVLNQHKATHRQELARMLVAAGEDAAPCVDFLASHIGMDRRSAAVLEWMGEAGTSALVDKLGCLSHGFYPLRLCSCNADGLEQRMAMVSLAAMGETGATALDGALAGEDATARRNAAEALSTMGERGPEFLAHRLSHPCVDVCLNAIWGLSTLRRVTPAAADALARKLEDESPEVRSSAAQALVLFEEVGGHALAQQLCNPSPRTQQCAAEALSSMGAVGAAAMVTKIGSDCDAGVRRRVGMLLEGLGEDGARALASRLQEADAGIRRRAVEALGRMGVCAAAYAPALAQLLEDKDNYVRVSAARALEALKQAARTEG
ncbi:unnamed protein product [Polarella glacialis]|uniref:Uncharacterized protein n=1 Tax=Polarella glacialis TaxID=89957 RepID=A0A813FLZ9_POLGL|nr:unnamed protein product [Polarella glacialis]